MKKHDEFVALYNSIITENTNTNFSIANELYNLYTNLSPNAKTKTGALVSEILKDILNELNDIVNAAERDPQQLSNLIKQLKFD